MRSYVSKAPLVAAVLTALVAASAAAQEPKPPPEGWQVRTDRGGHGGGDLTFQNMPPGWHITTGPGAILYHPEKRATGDFRVESETFLFDPGNRNEGFGLFIGGRDLAGEGQVYTYFLIRRDGSVLVKRRDGAGTSTLHGWAKHDAVVTWEGRGEGEGTAKNVLAIEAGPEALVFLVNGQEVFRTARADQHVEGVVGLRVNHALDLHVSSLEVTASG